MCDFGRIFQKIVRPYVDNDDNTLDEALNTFVCYYCCDIGQIDRFSIIELFPLSSCQVIILIARMTFNCFSSCLMS